MNQYTDEMVQLQITEPKITIPKILKVKKNLDQTSNFCKKPSLKFWTATNRKL